jgi:hypothetical protein
MRKLTRRDLLNVSLGWLASHGLTRKAFAHPTDSRVDGPRYVCLVMLGGGFDSIYTIDPKSPRDVEAGIDLPYSVDKIVDGGGVQLGPHFAGLKNWAKDMAIVLGVQRHTANHITGSWQFQRLKIEAAAHIPSILDIIGSRRDSQPLGSISVGSLAVGDYSPGWFGSPEADTGQKNLFQAIDELGPSDFEHLERALRSQARRLSGIGASGGAQTVANLEQVAAFFHRLPRVRAFKAESWFDEGSPAQEMAESFQRTLWAFQNDLSRSAFIRLGYIPWDSHDNNAKRQTVWNQSFASAFDRFLTTLGQLRNDHGSLSSNTLIIAGSELGRFPRLNSYQGKDHFPEAPFIFMGRNINTHGGKGSVFGRTGRQMDAYPVSLKTGMDVSSGGHRVDLDDVGATVLHLVGLDPPRYGYDGKILEFLEAV